MFHWRSGILVAAALAAACTTGTTDDPSRPHSDSNNPGAVGSNAGGGNAVPGAPGSAGSTASISPDCTQGIVPTSQIPRLNNAQYDRTVRDLLGITGLTASSNAPPSSILATDQAGSLTSLGWSSYLSVAEKIAAHDVVRARRPSQP